MDHTKKRSGNVVMSGGGADISIPDKINFSKLDAYLGKDIRDIINEIGSGGKKTLDETEMSTVYEATSLLRGLDGYLEYSEMGVNGDKFSEYISDQSESPLIVRHIPCFENISFTHDFVHFMKIPEIIESPIKKITMYVSYVVAALDIDKLEETGKLNYVTCMLMNDPNIRREIDIISAKCGPEITMDVMTEYLKYAINRVKDWGKSESSSDNDGDNDGDNENESENKDKGNREPINMNFDIGHVKSSANNFLSELHSYSAPIIPNASFNKILENSNARRANRDIIEAMTNVISDVRTARLPDGTTQSISGNVIYYSMETGFGFLKHSFSHEGKTYYIMTNEAGLLTVRDVKLLNRSNASKPINVADVAASIKDIRMTSTDPITPPTDMDEIDSDLSMSETPSIDEIALFMKKIDDNNYVNGVISSAITGLCNIKDMKNIKAAVNIYKDRAGSVKLVMNKTDMKKIIGSTKKMFGRMIDRIHTLYSDDNSTAAAKEVVDEYIKYLTSDTVKYTAEQKGGYKYDTNMGSKLQHIMINTVIGPWNVAKFIKIYRAKASDGKPEVATGVSPNSTFTPPPGTKISACYGNLPLYYTPAMMPAFTFDGTAAATLLFNRYGFLKDPRADGTPNTLVYNGRNRLYFKYNPGVNVIYCMDGTGRELADNAIGVDARGDTYPLLPPPPQTTTKYTNIGVEPSCKKPINNHGDDKKDIYGLDVRVDGDTSSTEINDIHVDILTSFHPSSATPVKPIFDREYYAKTGVRVYVDGPIDAGEIYAVESGHTITKAACRTYVIDKTNFAAKYNVEGDSENRPVHVDLSTIEHAFTEYRLPDNYYYMDDTSNVYLAFPAYDDIPADVNSDDEYDYDYLSSSTIVTPPTKYIPDTITESDSEESDDMLPGDEFTRNLSNILTDIIGIDEQNLPDIPVVSDEMEDILPEADQTITNNAENMRKLSKINEDKIKSEMAKIDVIEKKIARYNEEIEGFDSELADINEKKDKIAKKSAGVVLVPTIKKHVNAALDSLDDRSKVINDFVALREKRKTDYGQMIKTARDNISKLRKYNDEIRQLVSGKNGEIDYIALGNSVDIIIKGLMDKYLDGADNRVKIVSRIAELISYRELPDLRNLSDHQLAALIDTILLDADTYRTLHPIYQSNRDNITRIMRNAASTVRRVILDIDPPSKITSLVSDYNNRMDELAKISTGIIDMAGGAGSGRETSEILLEVNPAKISYPNKYIKSMSKNAFFLDASIFSDKLDKNYAVFCDKPAEQAGGSGGSIMSAPFLYKNGELLKLDIANDEGISDIFDNINSSTNGDWVNAAVTYMIVRAYLLAVNNDPYQTEQSIYLKIKETIGKMLESLDISNLAEYYSRMSMGAPDENVLLDMFTSALDIRSIRRVDIKGNLNNSHIKKFFTDHVLKHRSVYNKIFELYHLSHGKKQQVDIMHVKLQDIVRKRYSNYKLVARTQEIVQIGGYNMQTGGAGSNYILSFINLFRNSTYGNARVGEILTRVYINPSNPGYYNGQSVSAFSKAIIQPNKSLLNNQSNCNNEDGLPAWVKSEMHISSALMTKKKNEHWKYDPVSMRYVAINNKHGDVKDTIQNMCRFVTGDSQVCMETIESCLRNDGSDIDACLKLVNLEFGSFDDAHAIDMISRTRIELAFEILKRFHFGWEDDKFILANNNTVTVRKMEKVSSWLKRLVSEKRVSKCFVGGVIPIAQENCNTIYQHVGEKVVKKIFEIINDPRPDKRGFIYFLRYLVEFVNNSPEFLNKELTLWGSKPHPSYKMTNPDYKLHYNRGKYIPYNLEGVERTIGSLKSSLAIKNYTDIITLSQMNGNINMPFNRNIVGNPTAVYDNNMTGGLAAVEQAIIDSEIPISSNIINRLLDDIEFNTPENIRIGAATRNKLKGAANDIEKGEREIIKMIKQFDASCRAYRNSGGVLNIFGKTTKETNELLSKHKNIVKSRQLLDSKTANALDAMSTILSAIKSTGKVTRPM